MYLIDSDVFIDGKNRHYGLDIVPAFWDWLIQGHQEGKVFTVEECHKEVLAGGDELSTWMAAMPATFALKPTAADAPALQRVSQWAMSLNKRQGVAAQWLNSGDYYLVSQAVTLGYTVVTQEKPAPNAISTIKIPDACRAMGVAWMSPFEMLRQEGVRFKL